MNGRRAGMQAFLGTLDTVLAGAGYDVPAPPPPAPPPAPRPALSFDDWATLSERFPRASPHEMAPALAARGVTVDAWTRLDASYRRALSDEIRAGKYDLAAIYQARRGEVLGRDAGSPVPPPASVNTALPPASVSTAAPAALPIPRPAPPALTGTAGLPPMPEVMATVGRMPFVPPPPEPPVKPKPATKTVQSPAVPPRVDRGTMALDRTPQRVSPVLPFPGTDGCATPGYVPPLNARQWVALCAELKLQVASRLETMRRYQIATEAELRAVKEHWQHPSRRAEVENAMREFWTVLCLEALP